MIAIIEDGPTSPAIGAQSMTRSMREQPRIGVTSDWLVARRSLLTGALAAWAGASRTIGPINLQVLAHEATHQLTFNTGMLNRRGDVPRSIAEGLADYGEVRKTTGPSAPGQLHRQNLFILVDARRTDIPWYPVAQLLADDRPFLLDWFARLKTLAYAQGWLSSPVRRAFGCRRAN
jgi:Protein of unknown function (DUF1570)